PNGRTTPSVIERNRTPTTFLRHWATGHRLKTRARAGASSSRRRTGSAKSVRADERGNPTPRVWCRGKNSGANTMARRPWRGRQTSGAAELPCQDAVLLDLEVQSLVVGSEESRRRALIPPRGMKG